MGSFHSFEDIDAWKEARVLAREIRIVCDTSAVKKDWGWCDQITRAALSIMANIAEGNDTHTKAEFILFLSYAKRSAAEVRSHLYYGLDQQYLTPDGFAQRCARVKKISAQLAKLIEYLRKDARARKNLEPGTWNLRTSSAQQHHAH